MTHRCRNCCVRSLAVLIVVSFLCAIVIINWHRTSDTSHTLHRPHPHRPRPQLKDWHDYAAMARDAQRLGPGEHGRAAKLHDRSLLNDHRKLSMNHGFNVLLSDRISVNRSVPDLRHSRCHRKMYLEQLPRATIVMPFFNEHLSVLIRSVHSLINRSPRELLDEIILVDDCSAIADLSAPLDRYVSEYFGDRVRIVRLRRRSGLIAARLAGARQARSEVLIFMDSHVEANYNWLPPLLEPIACDPSRQMVVCPFIDVIDDESFAISSQDEGARGSFDWDFEYKRLPLRSSDMRGDGTRPFESPVMAGGLLAITSEFFWHLGGYDEGLYIWGGEQYELSFKIWMCGGRILDAPCSRVAHIYRGAYNTTATTDAVSDGEDFLHKNYKRVAEVWMDDYKRFLYARAGHIYDRIDPGDLDRQKALRRRLQCKSFDWYIKNIANDLLDHYPAVKPADFASGVVQSLAAPGLCLDTLSQSSHSVVGLYACSHDLQRPDDTQYWALNYRGELRLMHFADCLEVHNSRPNASVWMWDCHESGGNQLWFYDRETLWIRYRGRNGRRCLEADPKKARVFLNLCRKGNVNMRWRFGMVNDTALDVFSFE